MTKPLRSPALESESSPRSNKLLASLPECEFARISQNLQRVSFRLGDVLHDTNQLIGCAYFVAAGLVSRLATMENGEQVEVGLIGNEGVIGTQLVLGSTRTSSRTIAQAGGTVAYALPSEVLLQAFRDLQDFQRKTLRYIRAQAAIVTQIAACNCIHDAERRLARWLLMCRDRLGTDALPLTQEFLSQMLGVQRTTVTLVAGALHDDGLISYSRGKIAILDRQRLEKSACECYSVVHGQYLTLISDFLAGESRTVAEPRVFAGQPRLTHEK